LEKLEALERIGDSIFLVRGKSGGRFPYSNSILITVDNRECTLIDTGCGVETLTQIKKKATISQVINSHTHPDHSAGNWVFKDATKSIYVPEEGFETSGNIIALSERLAEPGWLAEYWRGFVSKILNFKDCRPTDSYNSETVFELGEVTLLPIHTPGHTIDHYCFYEPYRKIVFSFDYDLTSFGPWYGHRESSISAFKKSIEKLERLDIEFLVSGHGNIITSDIKKRLHDFGSKIDERNEKIMNMLPAGGKTIDELVDEAPIYGKYPYAEPLLRYWEGNMIKKHLEELVDEGKVVKREEKYSLS
jgi:glyoxylase-like metal-dependent hydrolase (beta-lactamase superfamily II)